MIERNTEKQIGVRLYFDGSRFIDWRIMCGWGDPTGSGLGRSRSQNYLVNHLQTLGARLRGAGKYLNSSTAVVPHSQEQQSGIDVSPSRRRSNEMIERNGDAGWVLRKRQTSSQGEEY